MQRVSIDLPTLAASTFLSRILCVSTEQWKTPSGRHSGQRAERTHLGDDCEIDHCKDSLEDKIISELVDREYVRL